MFLSALRSPAQSPFEASGSRLLAQRLLLIAAGAGLLALIVYARVDDDPAGLRLGLAASALMPAALAAGGAWFAWRQRPQAGVLAALLGLYAGATSVALITGGGLHTIAIGVYGLILAVAGSVLGLRALAAFAALTAFTLAGLYAAERSGHLAGAAALAALPLEVRFGTQILIVAVGAAFGAAFSVLLLHALRRARDQERRFAGLLEIVADYYWEQDERGRFSHLSDGARALFADPAAAIGKAPWELAGAQAAGVDWDAHRATLAARRPFRDLLVRRIGADGGEIHVSVSGQPLLDERGRPRGYWGVARDISADVRAQRARAASEARFRDLFDCAPAPMIVHRQGRIVLANEAAAALFGFAQPRAMAGRTMTDLNHADSRALSAQRIATLESLAVGASLPAVEIPMLRADGALLYVQASVRRIELADGVATLSQYFDLTERRRAEARLRFSEAMLSQLFEVTADSTTISDLDSSRLERVNAGFTRLTGWPREQAEGRCALELGVWFDASHRQRVLEALRSTGTAIDVPATLRRRDGELRQCVVSAGSFALDGHRYLVVTARDITATERERMQYQAILGNASIGIAVTRERRFTLANPALEAMCGWPRGSLVGQPGNVVWPSEADYAEVGQTIAPLLLAGQTADIERPVARRDGTSFLARLRASVIDPADPRHGGTVWIVEDVTERREFEQRLAQAKEQAEAASRAKSEFLANTSHEIRTPLNGLLGLAQLALQGRADATQQRHYLKLIHESAETLAAILSDVLDLSKIEAGRLLIEHDDFDLQRLLAGAHAAFAELASSRGLALTLEIAAEVPQRVRGDALRVRQIVSNLLANALKFTAEGSVAVRASVTADGRVRLAVQDTGVGIAHEVQERLFQPFTQADASTTRRYGGTGLGLSICRELAHLMGGEIGCTSQPGRGSTFWVELPLPPVPAAPAAAAAAGADEQPLAGRRVLIVEDNAVNLLIAEAFVSGWGAQVSSAGDGRQAIGAVEAAAAAGAPFAAVLMDLHMPVMSGEEALAELRRRWSPAQLPVIALTAAALTSERERALALGANDFLTKPIDAAHLLAALRRLARA